MDYEKKYKNALEWARKVIQGKVGFVFDEVLEKFPELSESDDERIRKALLEHCRKQAEIYNTLQTAKEYSEVRSWIAWIEKQGEQKPIWSEEDDYAIEILFCLLDNEQDNYPQLSSYFQDIERTKNWLKSIKEGYTWKPSDEQMSIFWDAICNLNHDSYKWVNNLKSLYQDLKKLIGK